MPLRNIILSFIIFSFVSTGAHADTAAREEKSAARLSLVHQMMDMTLAILQDSKKSFADREEVMARGIINMVDINRIAKSALGIGWRQASEAQRARYAELYRRYLTKMYISNFAQNAERKVSNMKTLGVDDVSDEEFLARTEVWLSGDKRMSVTYLVSERGGSNQIIDITVEGVSLLVTHRAEFGNILAARGVDGVIETLEHAVNEDAPKVQLSRAF